MAGSYDLTIDQGASFIRTLTWKDGAGSPVNVTGYTARLQMREHLRSETPFATLTTENGGITLGGSAGTIVLTLSAAATAALSAGFGVYDLELVSAGGLVTRLLEGRVILNPEITR